MDFFAKLCNIPLLLVKEEVMKLSIEIWAWISSKPEYAMAVFTLCATLWDKSTHKIEGLFKPAE
jgi:hypothetical protein